MSRNLVTEADRYEHEPYCFVTRAGTQQNLSANVYNKILLNDALINDTGSWDVGGGYYVCQKAGRIKTETTCVFFTGTSGSDAVQLVVRVDDSVGNLVIRFVLNQFGLVPNNTFYTLNGDKTFEVGLGMRLYPELFVQSTGAYILPNVAGAIYNAFAVHYVP